MPDGAALGVIESVFANFAGCVVLHFLQYTMHRAPTAGAGEGKLLADGQRAGLKLDTSLANADAQSYPQWLQVCTLYNTEYLFTCLILAHL